MLYICFIKEKDMLIKSFTKEEIKLIMSNMPKQYKKLHKGFKITAVIEHSVYVELAEDDKYTFLNQVTTNDYVSCLHIGATLLQFRREKKLQELLG